MDSNISIFKPLKNLSAEKLLKTIKLLEQQRDSTAANTSLNSELGNILEPKEAFNKYLDVLDSWVIIENTNRGEFLQDYHINNDWAYMNIKTNLSREYLIQLARLCNRFDLQMYSHDSQQFIDAETLQHPQQISGCSKVALGCVNLINAFILGIFFLSPLVFWIVDNILSDDPIGGQFLIYIGIPLTLIYLVILYKGWHRLIPLHRVIEILTEGLRYI